VKSRKTEFQFSEINATAHWHGQAQMDGYRRRKHNYQRTFKEETGEEDNIKRDFEGIQKRDLTAGFN